jgi:hypothetical protein
MVMIHDQLLTENSLMDTLQIKQRPALRKALDDMRIPYKLLPSGAVLTTLSAFNMRLHGYGDNKQTYQQADDEFA